MSTPADTGVERIRIGMAAGLAGMTVLHLVEPEPFEAMIPEELPGSARTLHLMAVVAEGTSAALLARRRTANLGGLLAFVTFLVVWLGNMEAVRQGGTPMAPGWFGSRTAAIIRLPFQLPLLRMAWRVATADHDRA